VEESLWTVNVTKYVSTVLAFVKEYLLWETQFLSFVIMCQLRGMLDGTIPSPLPTVLAASSINQSTSAYSY